MWSADKVEAAEGPENRSVVREVHGRCCSKERPGPKALQEKAVKKQK